MRVRVTHRDDEAPHQIRLVKQASQSFIHVSCTCRAENKNGQLTYESMGAVSDSTEAFRIFDIVSNHVVNKGVEFTAGMRTPVEVFYVD